ncbi:TPA: HNH endonuclease [Morganella morganii]|nr:HNH endonuclease [Morganella morganii]
MLINLNSNITSKYANMVICQVNEVPCFMPATYLIDSIDVTCFFKPQRYTALHDYISLSINTSSYEDMKNSDADTITDFYCDLDYFHIKYTKFECYNGTEPYHYYLFDIYKKIIPTLTKCVFETLFIDRLFMQSFNKLIAEKIHTLKVRDYPLALKRNGIINRPSHWPTWLRPALLRREHGRCALCQSDLTALLSSESKGEIDHIIPLNMGGSNDPTNLQLLCRKCNSDKGGNQDLTSGVYSTYW